MTELPQPAAPIARRTSHYAMLLTWEATLKEANEDLGNLLGDSRVKVQLQQLSPGYTEIWKSIYIGYGKEFLVESLSPWTQYMFKIQFSADDRHSAWSPEIMYTTHKEPLHGEQIHRAIRMQDIKILRHVLDSKEAPIDAPDQYGCSALMTTAQNAQIDMMQLLIENGADINYQSDIGKTALMTAAYGGKFNSVQLLRQNGAKYEVRDAGGSSALHWACDCNNPELVDWMLRDGANVAITDSHGRTPLLHLASLSGNRDITAVLVRHGADVNVMDKNKQTALMLAAVNGHGAMIEYLLDKNADVTVVNEYGRTAYDMAISMDKKLAAKILEEHMDRNGIKHR